MASGARPKYSLQTNAGGHHVAGAWGHGSAPRGVTARTRNACPGARGALPRWKCTPPSSPLIHVFQAG